MTAEVAILTKQCVALAADSVITVTSRMGAKTYDTGNKLFTLSKFHPVGVLTYGATELNTVPIEIIIKEFRNFLGKKSRSSIERYSRDFFNFVRTRLPRDRKDDDFNFSRVAGDHFRTLREWFRSECEKQRVPVGERKLSGRGRGDAVFLDVLKQFEQETRTARRNPAFARATVGQLRNRYRKIIEDRLDGEFRGYAPTPLRKRQLSAAVLRAILSNKTSDESSGIVITGYGAKSYYPSLTYHETEGFILGRLKVVSSGVTAIRTGEESEIFTFAQRNAAKAFLHGIDPALQQFIYGNIRTLIPGIADIAEKYLRDKRTVRLLRRRLSRTAEDFIKRIDRKRNNDFTRKIFDAVDLLDKPELAIFAENLVRLAALRQKVSLEIESVGGEIDVAVISRHDGFIWIKRKHYFDTKLNPLFVEKYLR